MVIQRKRFVAVNGAFKFKVLLYGLFLVSITILPTIKLKKSSYY